MRPSCQPPNCFQMMASRELFDFSDEDLQGRVEEFIERYYNESRLHSALGYCSPEKFERTSPIEPQRGSAAAVITFLSG